MTADSPATQFERMIQFFHHEKALAQLPGLSDELLANLYGVEVGAYCGARARFAARARDTARELLAEPDFAAWVDRLPFAPGDTIVGLGDSITDDLQSWFEILRELLALRRPGDGLVLVNAGVSGETTAQMLARFALTVAARQPAWILCMAGTNDARTHGPDPTKTLISADETAANLAALRHFAARATAARWLWLTPATVIEGQIAADPFLSGLQVRWRNADLDAVADAVRRQPDPHVDLQPLFGRPADPALLLPDGLHPSLAGQGAIVRAVVAALAG